MKRTRFAGVLLTLLVVTGARAQGQELIMQVPKDKKERP